MSITPDFTPLPDPITPDDDDPGVWEDFTPKGPGTRTVRTFVQALVAFIVAIPVALTAAREAGLDIPDGWIVAVTGIGAGLTVLASAANNLWDWYFGND